MRISQSMLDRIVEHARADAPDECCGMIAAHDGHAVELYFAENAAHSPLRYEIAPKDQYRIEMAIEDAGWELGAIYHSHTRSAPLPSQTDINLAFHPQALYIIVGAADPDRADVRAWRIEDGRVTEQELQVEEG